MALGPKCLYAAIYFYDLGISLPKYSAILFYMQVFGLNTRLYRINVWIALSLFTAWILFAIPSTIFQCTPVRKPWIPLTPGHCINNYQWFLGSAISSVNIDFYIMVLPRESACSSALRMHISATTSNVTPLRCFSALYDLCGGIMIRPALAYFCKHSKQAG